LAKLPPVLAAYRFAVCVLGALKLVMDTPAFPRLLPFFCKLPAAEWSAEAVGEYLGVEHGLLAPPSSVLVPPQRTGFGSCRFLIPVLLAIILRDRRAAADAAFAHAPLAELPTLLTAHSEANSR
jgi:hypothetical protein